MTVKLNSKFGMSNLKRFFFFNIYISLKLLQLLHFISTYCESEIVKLSSPPIEILLNEPLIMGLAKWICCTSDCTLLATFFNTNSNIFVAQSFGFGEDWGQALNEKVPAIYNTHKISSTAFNVQWNSTALSCYSSLVLCLQIEIVMPSS